MGGICPNQAAAHCILSCGGLVDRRIMDEEVSISHIKTHSAILAIGYFPLKAKSRRCFEGLPGAKKGSVRHSGGLSFHP